MTIGAKIITVSVHRRTTSGSNGNGSNRPITLLCSLLGDAFWFSQIHHCINAMGKSLWVSASNGLLSLCQLDSLRCGDVETSMHTHKIVIESKSLRVGGATIAI